MGMQCISPAQNEPRSGVISQMVGVRKTYRLICLTGEIGQQAIDLLKGGPGMLATDTMREIGGTSQILTNASPTRTQIWFPARLWA